MFDKAKFSEYERFFEQEHRESFELLKGEGRVLVSAPHSVEQIRKSKIKYAEPQTGVLVKMLHDAIRCPVIYKTKNCGDDANFDEDSPYKRAVVEYVKENKIGFLIDLHQMAPSREVGICIGTGKGKNISKSSFVDAAIHAFQAKKIGPIQVDTPFAAAYPFTVSSYVASQCGISCLQIEINSKILQLDTEESQADKVLEAFIELIEAISEMIRGN